ncbi:MAG TPA: zinc-dependent alcohol dehydrogenase family protein [Candidatus Saccharicenans sp.]|jgi:propanol-preferring alcohol dehydrogenase|nr:zinc-dependent alcohol dehydrogenase family protein [Candidatus Saccharicenans sp.]HRD02392.1 zinc-dependent alcohol dehydrogenase family protein [Candidatus Saccharicenans sp.]
MKAMVLSDFSPIESRPLKLKEVSWPKPGPDELLIRVSYCGVCHTDLHTVEGELPSVRLPRIPGHQVVGWVEKTGEKVTLFQTGERAGCAWLYQTCGHCHFCLTQRENLCHKAKFTGYDVDGGYAELVVVPESFAYKLPENFPDDQAAPLLCAGIIGYRSLRLSGLKPGEKLGLFGFGASAHVTIQVANYLGSQVYVFSRKAEHREQALKLGAVWAGQPSEDPPAKLEAAIVFAPVGEIARRALEVVDRGGTVALAGIYLSPVPELDYEEHLYYEKTLKSVANATRQDGMEFLKIAAEIPIRTEVHIFPLERANEALEAVKHSRINGAAVLKIR